MSVLGYSTRLKTHAPSFPPLRSLPRQELQRLVPSCCVAKPILIVFGMKDMICTGILCSFMLPYANAWWIEKIESFCKETHRESCGSSRAGSSWSLSAGQRHRQAAPIQHLPRAANPMTEGAFPGPCSAGFRERGGRCSEDIAGFKTEELPKDSGWVRSGHLHPPTISELLLILVAYFSPFVPGVHASPTVILFVYYLSISLHQPASARGQAAAKDTSGLQLRLKSSYNNPEQTHGCWGLLSLHVTVNRAKI